MDFGNDALTCFSTITDFDNYEWENNYENCFFKINTTICVKSRLFNYRNLNI